MYAAGRTAHTPTMKSELGVARADGGRLVSRRAALVSAVAVVIGSVALVALNLLVPGLTCGDDGPLDYGTGGAGTERYCRISFDEDLDGTSHLSAPFTTLSVLALGVAVVAGAALVITRRRGWLYGSLALLALLGAWTVALLAVL